MTTQQTADKTQKMTYVKADVEKSYMMYTEPDENRFQLVFSRTEVSPLTIEVFLHVPFAEFRKTEQWKEFHEQMTMWLKDNK